MVKKTLDLVKIQFHSIRDRFKFPEKTDGENSFDWVTQHKWIIVVRPCSAHSAHGFRLRTRTQQEGDSILTDHWPFSYDPVEISPVKNDDAPQLW